MKLSKKSSAYLLITIGIAILFIGIFISVSMGPKDISLNTMINSFISNSSDVDTKIIRDVRMPRAIAAALVGGFLAVSGAIMQGITRNPIADPSVMGITQGATFTIAIALVLQKVVPGFAPGSFGLMIFSFLGASISGLLVYFISSRTRKKLIQ
ncbi:FecCD family ABC transporter permease [Paraclostridium sp. AKS81]|uniref:FecCD family ABC transporter permease n=1 Tax=Paraclostridium sp. AKS81 TaxID=2876117 RepID=UPI002FCD4751